MSNFWAGKRVAVTGGCGFIGSHTVEALIRQGATVTAIDNLQKGTLGHLYEAWNGAGVATDTEMRRGIVQAAGGHRFVLADLMDPHQATAAIAGNEVVIHLAANIGGRGYIDTHPASVCESWVMNHNVFDAARKHDVDRIHYSSTACVYPMELQDTYDSDYTLKEPDAFQEGWANCDGAYGWSKFMGEVELTAFHKQYGTKGSIVRYVTAYGPRENDTHAIIALIKKAVERWDPYPVWGTGNQDRDFTYSSDIVRGSLLATEKVTDCTPINLGTSVRHKIRDVVDMILGEEGWRPSKGVFYDTTKPEGVRSRALDHTRASKLLGWEPQVDVRQGLAETMAWYRKARPVSMETLETRPGQAAPVVTVKSR